MGKLLPYVSLLVLLSFAVIFAQAQEEPTARILLQAQKLLEEAKADEAIKLLRSTKTSSESETAYFLGVAYHLKGDYVQAVEQLSAAVKRLPQKDPKYRNAIQILGLSHYVLGHPADAIPYLEQTSRLLPDSTEIAYALGSCYIQTRERDKSREVFARMFKVPGASAAAYLINAQMMMRQRFEVLAEQELQKALALDPKLPQINFLLAEIAIYNAQIDRGIALLQKEIEINPTFAMAEGMLRRATQMDPNNFSAHHLLAQVLQRANRAEEAKKEFETAERLRAAGDKQP
jgi:tetratricopeptide (TPR) repeat protein